MTSPFDDLPKNQANYAPLTPLTFIERAAYVYPDRLAVVHGTDRWTWKQTYARCRRLASAAVFGRIGVLPGAGAQFCVVHGRVGHVGFGLVEAHIHHLFKHWDVGGRWKV